jgi:hypothetical protein
MEKMKSGYIETFRHLSQFENLKDFNRNIKMFLAEHEEKFTKSEMIAFRYLTRFSARVPGVCNAKIQTIVAAINKDYDDFGVSRSTFERMLRKAKKLGILVVHNTERSGGGKGHNVFVFQRFDASENNKTTYRETEKLTDCKNPENPTETSADEQQAKAEVTILETNNLKNKDKNTDINHLNVSQPKRKPYLKGLPKRLQHFQAFFGKHAKSMYWRVWLAAKKLGVDVIADDLQQIAYQIFDQLKRALAEGRRFTTEELHKYVYVSAREQIKERLENGEIEDLNRMFSGLFAVVDRRQEQRVMPLDEARSIFGL